MWKMSICSNARWRQTDRLAASLCNVFWAAGPSLSGAVIYLSICSVLRGEERREMAEASLYQRGLARSWGIGNIIGLLSLLAMAPIRHFSLPLSPTPVACRHSWGDEAVLAFQALSRDNPKQDLSLVLTVAFIWSEEVFLLSLPPALPLHSATASLPRPKL